MRNPFLSKDLRSGIALLTIAFTLPAVTGCDGGEQPVAGDAYVRITAPSGDQQEFRRPAEQLVVAMQPDWTRLLAPDQVSVDGAPWQPAQLADAQRQHGAERTGLAWRFWTLDLGPLDSGDHTITSRAIALGGALQPSPDDPVVADRRTYWESNGWITRTVRI